jgi:hypothetical protein
MEVCGSLLGSVNLFCTRCPVYHELNQREIPLAVIKNKACTFPFLPTFHMKSPSLFLPYIKLERNDAICAGAGYNLYSVHATEPDMYGYGKHMWRFCSKS